MRLVWVETSKEVLLLVTNQEPQEMPAELVAALYRQRWRIELFFRWIKCILGCRHWLAESPRGVAIEIYLALIAALLLQLYSGRRPNRRMLELIQLYLLGWPVAKIFKLAGNATCCISRKAKHHNLNCLLGLFVAQSRRAFPRPDAAPCLLNWTLPSA